MLLVTRAAKTLMRYEHPNLGRLIQPRHFGGTWPGYWAADNDCFQGLDRRAYLKMLVHLCEAKNDRLLFVTAPDVVADAEETSRRFDIWEPLLHELELPIAFVGQDGLDIPPWDRFETFFVGGSTEWKMSMTAARLVREAKERGKWVHMGRVNSVTRIRYAQSISCDSIDGTSFSMFADTYIAKCLAWIDRQQMGLAL